jgi:trk system potassium uptake protein TrkH
MVCYLAVFAVSVIMLSLEETDLVTNFTAVASAVNNIGPGLEKVGPMSNFGHLSILSKLTLTFDMLAGRLELFPMLVLFNPSTWKK